jgi:hypothetical protein
MFLRAGLAIAVAVVAGSMAYAVIATSGDGPSPRPFDPATDLTFSEVLDAEDRGEIRSIDYNGDNIRVELCDDDRVYRGDVDDEPALEDFLSRNGVEPGGLGSNGSSTFLNC